MDTINDENYVTEQASPEKAAYYRDQLLQQGYAPEDVPAVIYVQRAQQQDKNKPLRKAVKTISIVEAAFLVSFFLWGIVLFSKTGDGVGADQAAGWLFLIPVCVVMPPLTLAALVMSIVLLVSAKGNKEDRNMGIIGLLCAFAPIILVILIMLISFVILSIGAAFANVA